MATTSARSAASKKNAPAYRCTECGWTSIKWVGRCGECQEWGSVTDAGGATVRTAAVVPLRPAVPIGEVSVDLAKAQSTGVGEFDRVLGGGLVPGAVVL
ncbi:MAG: DNA repair protein RadA, partial [Ornithinimicrobium sp.]